MSSENAQQYIDINQWELLYMCTYWDASFAWFMFDTYACLH